ncbi:hypothetical protein EC973_008553 [Apophysomyces ossiformis]|uniref:RING-type domain-containing protein n=1 Tax=Apophysomyces ossiformis TaxID=679940 RepID=A0A8H7EP37_9FUNG|nr:hypothetical protein EC973_008553 [Apophysomyces ossiformis]
MERDTDNASSRRPREDMDYWLERCSICFDARLDLCLEYCRDQYCLDCFRRYVTEVVVSSWGLSVTKVRCPVCQNHIPQSEWSKFVPSSVVEQYNRFNRPYRSFTRCCPRCETEVAPCEYKTEGLLYSRGKRVHDMMSKLILSCPLGEYHSNDPTHTTIQRMIKIFSRQQWRNSTLVDTYQRTMKALISFVETHTGAVSLQSVFEISHQILQLDMKPETWKRLQFAHISFFPSVDW